jgi:glycosyl transferase family 25
VWEEFLASDADQLLVFEDDIVVDWEGIEGVMKRDFGKDGIHYLRLACLAVPPAVYKGEFLGRYLVHYLGYALGSQAYLFTRQGAAHMVKYCQRVRSPIDDMMDRSWWGALPNLGVHPALIMFTNMASSIGGSRSVVYKVPARLQFARFRFRVAEKIRSRGYRLLMSLGFGPKISAADSRWI